MLSLISCIAFYLIQRKCSHPHFREYIWTRVDIKDKLTGYINVCVCLCERVCI